MAENVDNQTNNVKTYTLTAKSTAAQVFTIAQAFVSGHIRLNAGAASAEVLQQFKDFVSALRGDTKDQEKKQDDDKKSDSKTSQTVSLKIGGLTSTWTYDFKDFEEHSFDQIGAAQRLADMCEGHVAYDSDRDEWRAWNSQRWVWINSSLNQLTQLTREVLSCILTEAQLRFPSGFEDIKKKIEGLATQPKMIQILKLAQTEDLLGVSNVRYNSYNYLINTINGEVNITKSNELFRQSAEAGYSAAYSRMALIYFNGEGVEKNLKIAKYWAWLDFANLPEDSRENSILVQLIEPGDVNEDNQILFKKIIEEAADAGERDAMDNWASGLNNTGEKEKALALWQKAADLKHPNGMCNVARQCWTEKVKDYERARVLFEEASKSGNEHAFYGLAVIYYQGLGVDRDVKKAWEYLEKAINKGDTESRYLFATMCLSNDFQTILPDKVMRGMSYMEQAAMDKFQPAIDFYNNREFQ